jgi:histidinol-phosphate aminotransferase
MKKHLKGVYRKNNQEDKTKFKYVLTQNERNYPIAHDLLDKFFDSLTQTDLTFYPNTEILKSKICDYHNIEKENLLLTPGSTFSIKTIFETFDVKGNNVITSDYNFPMYQVYSELYEVELRKAKYRSMKLDIQDLLYLIDGNTKFIILANPNSPLGDLYTEEEIKILLNTGIPVVIDEAYIEFTGQDSCMHLIQSYPNLIVTKTFSKAYGAAGCRVGFMVSSKEKMEYFSKFRAMYEINGIGAKYTEFILDNIQDYNSYINKTFKNKKIAIKQLKKAGHTIIDTDASWFFLKRWDKEDNLKKFNKMGMTFRTLILPDGIEYIKFNYDLKLHYDHNNPFE